MSWRVSALVIALFAGPVASATADDFGAMAKSTTGIDLEDGGQRAAFSKRAAFVDGFYRGRLALCGDEAKSIAFRVLMRHARDSEKLDILKLANAGFARAKSNSPGHKSDPDFCKDALRLKQANDSEIFKTLGSPPR